MAYAHVTIGTNNKHRLMVVSETETELCYLNLLKRAMGIVDENSDRLVYELSEAQYETLVGSYGLVRYGDGGASVESLEALALGFVTEKEIPENESYEYGMRGFPRETFNKRKRLMKNPAYVVGKEMREKMIRRIGDQESDQKYIGSET